MNQSRPWTPQEEGDLMSYVNVFGIGNWQVIALRIGTRTASQCRRSCTTTKTASSSNEDNLLITAVWQYGSRNWDRISQSVVTRGPRECQARWRQLNFHVHNLNRLYRALIPGGSGAIRRYRIRPQRRALNVNRPQFANTIQTLTVTQNAMSINRILTHDRDIRMTLGYILENTINNPVPHFFNSNAP
ncbi:hypothetical protein C1645_803416 [Glomus cerebriforme]|uniref:Homeodomain-like protein n=1 Tax=Glomus cerebriforme TaxID=658196 RepID=A0A397TEF8_9GLOM|nr:hypothetical protein C1645_803416 [Glomus cerebriforme]